ncbi:RNA 2'-phosphotransferase, partial [Escherichia coli]|uniref:RNA 2'-phosphotransferase n=2 Tax=Pseudomonadota TaxID=1224 RepID=UPI0028DE5AB1
MHPSELKSLSKFLSLILRHEPERIGLALDDAGWAGIGTLLEKAAASGRPMTREQLEAVVETSDKKRFAISEDGQH